MKISFVDNIWDAIEPSKSQAANMKARGIFLAIWVALISSTVTSNRANSAVFLNCEQDLFDKEANNISLCISCDKSLSPQKSISLVVQKINSIVDQCMSLEIKLKDQISDGDDLYFAEAADLVSGRLLGQKVEHSSIGYSIESSGGDVDVAMKLAELLYNKRIPFINVGRCYSSCPIAIAGARFRNFLPETSDVRIHRLFPTTTDMDFETWTKYEADKYRKLVDFFDQYGVSRELVDRMKVTPSTELKKLSVNELEFFGLGKKNVRFADELRFEITKNCGKDRYLENLHAPEQLVNECAPNLK